MFLLVRTSFSKAHILFLLQELVLDQEKRSSASAIPQNGGVNGSSNANGGGAKTPAERSPVSPAESDRSSSNITDLGIHSNTHSRYGFKQLLEQQKNKV